ncbi:hypothetical protein CY0110_26158 [Crocosphaera chwakensis CCY0110]|uniref:PEP-CTERM protein-sorting domain-containing protein n=1 Tax=Crocosphaera chwakensis CCY0110 TaxID=391612 RepID=A3IPB6_9CHRO|nr:hypothetical protein CY0110_26158 [Crocosphaera chwakensis CCY0110]
MNLMNYILSLLPITTTLSVPEPSTIIGLGILTTFGLGTGFKRKLSKANK